METTHSGSVCRAARGKTHTLVVETTNFLDKMHYVWQTYWRAPSETMRLVERFTRVAPDTIDYEMTLTDPGKFPRPWTIRIPITKTGGVVLRRVRVS